MLPLGKNCILDFHFPCHRTECETEAREIRGYVQSPQCIQSAAGMLMEYILFFRENKAVLSQIIFRLLLVFVSNLFKSVCSGIRMMMEKQNKAQGLKY